MCSGIGLTWDVFGTDARPESKGQVYRKLPICKHCERRREEGVGSGGPCRSEIPEVGRYQPPPNADPSSTLVPVPTPSPRTVSPPDKKCLSTTYFVSPLLSFQYLLILRAAGRNLSCPGLSDFDQVGLLSLGVVLELVSSRHYFYCKDFLTKTVDPHHTFQFVLPFLLLSPVLVVKGSRLPHGPYRTEEP